MYAIRSYYDAGLLLEVEQQFEQHQGIDAHVRQAGVGHDRFRRDVAVAVGEIRITSYNVCYTKLLRPT